MNLKDLRSTNWMMFDCVAGSHAYGTNVESSDIDYRGIFMHPDINYLTMNNPVNQISDAKNDTTYYSLKRFFELTSKATPNTLELLWMPDDTVKYENEAFKYLKSNRDLFISKKCYYTFTGYAHTQIKKSRSRGKLINSSLTDGFHKLKNLYNDGKITKEWIESRFGSNVSSCI